MRRVMVVIMMVGAGLFLGGCDLWSGGINSVLPEQNRPTAVAFDHDTLSAEQFTAPGSALQADYHQEFSHLAKFREAGITSYEGPQTCLRCHEEIDVEDPADGTMHRVNLMDNLTSSAHYRFYTTEHPNVYGFNGKLADDFRMGKINRPCPKPGSFAMTAWAAPVVLENGDTLSEGCGQCHIGGQPTAPLGEMMPGYTTKQEEKDAIDCLICHSVGYDMNRKQVRRADDGRWYWDQDR